jgi:ribose 1,5-bisphosphokinase PhnN
MVIAKAVNLSWSAAQEILMLRAKKGVISRSEILQRLTRFERLQSGTAQEILRIYRSRAQSKATPAT